MCDDCKLRVVLEMRENADDLEQNNTVCFSNIVFNIKLRLRLSAA